VQKNLKKRQKTHSKALKPTAFATYSNMNISTDRSSIHSLLTKLLHAENFI